MASPQWSASTLLALLILLYWTTSSAWSHSSTDRSALHRIARDLDFETRQKTEKVLETATNSLSLLNDVMGKIDTNSLKSMMKNLANFASLAPGVGAVISSVINTVLVFIPQEDPVLTKLDLGFAEVNRKLDSLSTQISDLATDVEWFNYISVYSQDELRILNTWRKFEELFKKKRSNDFNSLAGIFTNYYEYTQTEASVANLYHYLTVKTTSLSGNLNDMLKRKFKCDLSQIYKYNFHFSGLLWKGLVLKEGYLKLIGFDTAGQEAEHAQMFKNVHEVQRAVVEHCLDNSEKYARDDVEEIAKKNSPEKKEEIAKKVKDALDKKYNWYNWVVLVYDKKQEDDKYIYVYDMTKIPISDSVIVAVTYTLKAGSKEEKETEGLVTKLVEECFNEKNKCQLDCSYFPWGFENGLTETTFLKDFAKVTIATYNKEFVVFPLPAYRRKCLIKSDKYDIFVHNSKKLQVCKHNPCQNNGQCKQLLKSNEWLCVCQDGYYGDTCDKKMNIKMPLNIITTITTTKARLKSIESKLDHIMKRCWG
ncbi:SE-cephalotoxin-like isoform X2 [Colossoma macropomum]|nr:SE-cephalotoxin-like isoform X2 [Colossoma macropomum]XP_036449786.1 SE-cephalotoxin-like isoform X2 [Colossoma macropomum]